MNKNELATMYQSYLTEEGYAPKIDEDGDVIFKFEGGTYFISVPENDDIYFRLVYPAFWKIENDGEKERAVKAALDASTETKVAKVYLVRDHVWAAIELFCSPIENFRLVFKRSLGALQTSVGKFTDHMKATKN